MMIRTACNRYSAAALALLGVSGLATAAPSTEKIWQKLQQQQKQIEALKQENAKLAEQLEVSAQMAEQANKPAEQGHSGKGKTSIGGYGELHYNNLDSKKEVDLHRFVLFFGHEFNQTTRFVSELEIEHALAGESKPGEVELEQAYIEHDLGKHHHLKAGVMLVPVGILNETHEPETFYGTERNPVEKNIIPTTWWEAGIALNGEIAPGWSYDVGLTSGLSTPTTGSSAYLIRSGRTKTAKAPANDGALTGRIKWTGIPGLELAATVQFQQDITQGTDPTAGAATLIETHAVYQKGPFGVRALYANWDLDGSGPAAIGRDKQEGWYVETSYKVTPKFGLFARYNNWDNSAGDNTDSEKTQTDFGVNYWLHENVVFKADIQKQGGTANDDGFNLGVGYSF